jgi:preprotein translocase subunit YajC
VDKLAPLIILALPVLMLWWMSSRARRQQRELAAVNASLAVGDSVMTSSGLFGQITTLSEESVELQIAPGIVTRWDRRAIVRPAPIAARADASVPAADPDPPESD